MIAASTVALALGLIVWKFDENPSRYQVFTRGPDFVLGDADLTCIGWVAGRQDMAVTAVGPSHAVFAAHYRNVRVGSTLEFMDRAGALHRVQVSAIKTDFASPLVGPGDLGLATFSTPLPSTVSPAVVMPASELSIAGETLYVYGRTGLMGTNRVPIWWTDLGGVLSFEMSEFRASSPPGTAISQTGDSGSPTFVWPSWSGCPILVGVRWYPTTDSYVPSYATQLAAQGVPLRAPCPPPQCRGDFNRDGVIDLFDLFEYWEFGSDIDLNGDTLRGDIFDTFTLFEYFDAGC